MKKFIALGFFALIFGSISSCDRVKQPKILVEDVDPDLYPGNFAEYTAPTFAPNTNTLRNVLIEDFTGHKCSGCPNAAAIAHSLEVANPGRVFVATIHAGPSNNGMSYFQSTSAPDFTYDFTNPEGLEIASTFYQLDVGFGNNPSGTVNRISDESSSFVFHQGQWTDLTSNTLESELKVNLQAKSNYFPETKGVYLHVESEFLETLEGTYNIVAYAIQKKIIATQQVGSEIDFDYEHHNVHLGNVFNETWGRTITHGTTQAGTKIVSNLSYQIPSDLTKEEIHFQIFVYNRDTYEIMHVIEHEIE